MTLEMMDIVNLQDEVIGQDSIDNIYKNLPPHRIVHTMIFDSRGNFGLQKRSMNKSYKPGHWTTAVSGHPQAGESYDQGATREGLEELGKNLVLTNFVRLDDYHDYERPNLVRFLGVFEAVDDGPFQVNTEEVEDFRFFPREEVQKMINDGEPFHPELLFILNKSYGFSVPENA